MSRQQLLKLRSSLGFSQNVLQYMGTFSRERNWPAPDWPNLSGHLSDGRFNMNNLGLVPNPGRRCNLRSRMAKRRAGKPAKTGIIFAALQAGDHRVIWPVLGKSRKQSIPPTRLPVTGGISTIPDQIPQGIPIRIATVLFAGQRSEPAGSRFLSDPALCVECWAQVEQITAVVHLTLNRGHLESEHH